ncbi:MAG: 2-oxo acid dehydrogenase subunit E2 [Cyclobacteriaceae bacterium]|nr:2-oxo acid dehydrogenase subunit E2 [Cyclobacteriaceae bacterium]
MVLIEMVMPKMGESIMEATVLSWLKKEGETIEADESVLEVATDKVDTEVPSTHGGILKEIIAREGEVVPVGQTIAIIETEEVIKHPLGLDDLPDDYEQPEGIGTREASNYSGPTSNGLNQLTGPGTQRFYSPLVKSIARQENISLKELETLSGSGKKNRLTKNDVLAFIAEKKSKEAAKIKAVISVSDRPIMDEMDIRTLDWSGSGEDEIVEMDRMRKMIAERMVESKRISPHVTSFVEADVTGVVMWREKVKAEFEKRYNQKITFTPIFIEAVIMAIKDFPLINISVEGDKIIKKNHINIGMAVALPNFNLIVPVIHQADQYNLIGLCSKVNDLARRARNNQLKPEELSGGTYTVTNVGSFGNLMGTPIIVQPQAAILALGAIVKKPSVIDTPAGDAIGIRHKMFLSHSYDHRVIDGALGGAFIRKVADYLEDYDLNREI